MWRLLIAATQVVNGSLFRNRLFPVTVGFKQNVDNQTYIIRIKDDRAIGPAQFRLRASVVSPIYTSPYLDELVVFYPYRTLTHILTLNVIQPQLLKYGCRLVSPVLKTETAPATLCAPPCTSTVTLTQNELVRDDKLAVSALIDPLTVNYHFEALLHREQMLRGEYDTRLQYLRVYQLEDDDMLVLAGEEIEAPPLHSGFNST